MKSILKTLHLLLKEAGIKTAGAWEFDPEQWSAKSTHKSDEAPPKHIKHRPTDPTQFDNWKPSLHRQDLPPLTRSDAKPPNPEHWPGRMTQREEGPHLHHERMRPSNPEERPYRITPEDEEELPAIEHSHTIADPSWKEKELGESATSLHTSRDPDEPGFQYDDAWTLEPMEIGEEEEEPLLIEQLKHYAQLSKTHQPLSVLKVICNEGDVPLKEIQLKAIKDTLHNEKYAESIWGFFHLNFKLDDDAMALLISEHLEMLMSSTAPRAVSLRALETAMRQPNIDKKDFFEMINGAMLSEFSLEKLEILLDKAHEFMTNGNGRDLRHFAITKKLMQVVEEKRMANPF